MPIRFNTYSGCGERIVLDEETSILKDLAASEKIKRSLIACSQIHVMLWILAGKGSYFSFSSYCGDRLWLSDGDNITLHGAVSSILFEDKADTS